MASVPEPHWKEKRDDERIMVLKVGRDDFEAILSERKRWAARPLLDHRGRCGWYVRLATEGRLVKFQLRKCEWTRPYPYFFVRVAEVRFYEPNERSSIPPEQAMVMELGTDLLPDVADASTRVQVYRDYYGADTCAHGFVAMRLEREDFRATVSYPYRRQKVKVTVRKTSGEIWVEIDAWPVLTTLADIVFAEAQVDRFDLHVPYLIYNARVQPYWKSLMQFPVVRDGGEALELTVVFQPKDTPIRNLFDKVKPIYRRAGLHLLESDMPYDTFKYCLTNTSPREPRYMDMQFLMNTLYPEQRVIKIWGAHTEEITTSSNRYSVLAYPLDAVDGHP